MSEKESKPAAGKPPAQKSAAQQARERAKPVNTYTASWIGLSPTQLDPAVVDGNLTQYDIEDVFERPLVIYGYSEREGDKGKFAVVLCSKADDDSLFVVVTGGSVVLKKLFKVADAKGFPISGQFKHCTGKNFAYFDLV